MANSLLLLEQHEKLLKDAQQEITRQSSKEGGETAAASADSVGRKESEDA